MADAEPEKLVKKGNLETEYSDQLIEVDLMGLQKDNAKKMILAVMALCRLDLYPPFALRNLNPLQNMHNQ